MGKDHRGHPSGVNKDEGGTGVPSGKFVDDLQKDEELTDKYTSNDEEEVANSVRQNNPNRNTDKKDATNAGGYRN